MLRFILCLVFFIPTLVLPAQEIATRSTAVERARDIAQKLFKKEKLPGMAVAVYHKGEVVWSEGFGYADVENEVPVDPKTSLFRIGSVSKTLTAAGIMLLWQQDKLDLDAEIQDYVPNFPKKRWPVTVRQVASHIAGVRHYRGFENFSSVHYKSVNDGLVIFAKDTLLFEPGTKYSYSSYGWNLLSAAVEGASGEAFLPFMEQNIFQPFGMHRTMADDATRNIDGRVSFYQRYGDAKDFADAMPVDNSYKWAGGGFIAPVEDLLKFGHHILQHEFLNEETVAESWKSSTLNDGKPVNYGIGWRSSRDKKDRYWVGHSGGSVGGTTMFLMYPEKELIVATVVNLSRAPTGDLAFRIAEQFLSNE